MGRAVGAESFQGERCLRRSGSGRQRQPGEREQGSRGKVFFPCTSNKSMGTTAARSDKGLDPFWLRQETHFELGLMMVKACRRIESREFRGELASRHRLLKTYLPFP